jgi:DivIVA domain-containing protein
MALLTAEDILNKKFTATKFKEGYDQDEVDDYLDEIVRTISAMSEENEQLRAQLAAAEARVADAAKAEGAAAAPLAAPVAAPEPVVAPVPVAAPAPAPAANEPEAATGLMALAQQLHDEHVRRGQEEGDRMVNEARTEGERIVREAEDTRSRTLTQLEGERSLLERKIDELRTFERDYRLRLSGFLKNLLGELDQRALDLPQAGGSTSEL